MNLTNIMKYAIGSSEKIKSAHKKEKREIDDVETLADGASDSAKLMERMTTIYLHKYRGKPNNYVRK